MVVEYDRSAGSSPPVERLAPMRRRAVLWVVAQREQRGDDQQRHEYRAGRRGGGCWAAHGGGWCGCDRCPASLLRVGRADEPSMPALVGTPTTTVATTLSAAGAVGLVVASGYAVSDEREHARSAQHHTSTHATGASHGRRGRATAAGPARALRRGLTRSRVAACAIAPDSIDCVGSEMLSAWSSRVVRVKNTCRWYVWRLRHAQPRRFNHEIGHVKPTIVVRETTRTREGRQWGVPSCPLLVVPPCVVAEKSIRVLVTRLGHTRDGGRRGWG
jgi:hypothetical protein